MEEANAIKSYADSLKKNYKDDVSVNIFDYDTKHSGIEASYAQWNANYNCFSPLEEQYRTLTFYLGDGDDSWTNDKDHIVFPKYLLEGIEVMSDDELMAKLKEYGVIENDEFNLETDPEEFISWVIEEFEIDLELIYDRDDNSKFSFYN